MRTLLGGMAVKDGLPSPRLAAGVVTDACNQGLPHNGRVACFVPQNRSQLPKAINNHRF